MVPGGTVSPGVRYGCADLNRARFSHQGTVWQKKPTSPQMLCGILHAAEAVRARQKYGKGGTVDSDGWSRRLFS